MKRAIAYPIALIVLVRFWGIARKRGYVTTADLVPAAIMCIGAANLFASNVFREFSPERTLVETLVARVLTLVMCACGLLLIFFVPVPYDIDFQLLGGALMLQIFPAFVLGLWTLWFHARALVLGWAAGLLASCAMAYAAGFGPNFTVHAFGISITGCIALYGLIVNLGAAVAATIVQQLARAPAGIDRTRAGDYA